MGAFGILLSLAGMAGMLGGYVKDSAIGHTVNLDLLNIKLLLMTGGGALFVAGCVLFGAGAIADAISASATKPESSPEDAS